MGSPDRAKDDLLLPASTPADLGREDELEAPPSSLETFGLDNDGLGSFLAPAGEPVAVADDEADFTDAPPAFGKAEVAPPPCFDEVGRLVLLVRVLGADIVLEGLGMPLVAGFVAAPEVVFVNEPGGLIED